MEQLLLLSVLLVIGVISFKFFKNKQKPSWGKDNDQEDQGGAGKIE